MKNYLPYLTKNGHEFYIKWESKVAHVTCHNEDGNITENLSEQDIAYMMETVMILGTESMVLNTNYGVDIHSHTLATNPKYKAFRLNKLFTI